MTSYLSENEAENLQNGDVHLAQIPDFEMKYLENHWRIEVGDGSFFCIFHALSFKLNFFFDRRCPLNYALQEDNEEIFGDQSKSTFNVNLAEDTIIKQGIKLPKSESKWKTANSFFHANLPIEDMNTDGDFNDIATNFG